jgi:Flp pilus assembly protein TadD
VRSVAIAFALGGVVGGCSGARLSDHVLGQPTLRVADAALAAGAPDMALRVADIVLAKHPRDIAAFITRGDSLYALGQGDMARAAYRAAIAIDPTAASANVGLGRTLVKSDPRSAEAAFLSALTKEPDNIVALNNLGVARDLQGRSAEAQEAYRKALTVAPGSADVQINLGMSLALSGRRAEAAQLLRGVVAVPGAARAWRYELFAGLSLAGDGPSAQQILMADPTQTTLEPASATEGARLAAATTPARIVSSTYSAKGSVAVEPGHATQSVPNATVAEISVDDQVPRVNSAPRTAFIATELPAIVSGVDVTPSVTIRPVVAVPRKLGKVSSAETASMSSLVDIAREDSVASVSEPSMQITASTPTASVTTGGAVTDDRPYVQLGSLLSEPDAMFEWHRLNGRFPALLRGREATMTQAEVHGRTYWRLRAWYSENIAEANELCGQLKVAGLHCWTGRGL